MRQLPSYKGTVFRGTNLTPEQAAIYKKGEVVKEKAFTSSSATEATAFSGNTRFLIKSETGKDISILSDFQSEKEILFAPHTQFRVLSVDVNSQTGLREIFMVEIPKGGLK